MAKLSQVQLMSRSDWQMVILTTHWSCYALMSLDAVPEDGI